MKKMIAAICAVALLGLAPAAIATAAGHHGNVVKGRTAQKRHISVAFHRNSVELKHFVIKLRCRRGGVLIDKESGFLPSGLRHHNRIHDHQVGSTDDVFIRGRLFNHRLKGAIRVRDRWGKNNPCDSHWVRFSVRRP